MRGQHFEWERVIVIRGINHAGFVVRDLEVAVKFYEEIVGLRVQDRLERTGALISQVVGYDDAHLKIAKMAAEGGGALPGTDRVRPAILGGTRVGGESDHRRQPRRVHRRRHTGHLRASDGERSNRDEPTRKYSAGQMGLLHAGPRRQLDRVHSAGLKRPSKQTQLQIERLLTPNQM